jgi:hypothetical protein
VWFVVTVVINGPTSEGLRLEVAWSWGEIEGARTCEADMQA